MEIDDRLVSLISKSDRRYVESKERRENFLNKLNTTDILSVDTPTRVALRLERVANHPLAQMMIAEAQKIENDRLKIISPSEFQRLVQERVIGRNDLMPVNYLEYAVRVSQSVGRVIVRNDGRRVLGYGTGSMVSPQLLLTNNHVLSTKQEARSSLIEFNYQSDIDGQMRSSQSYQLDPDTFFVSDRDLDYTIVAVKDGSNSQPAVSSFGWNRLIEEQGKVIVGEYVNIIQHPSGEPKQLALRENQVVDLLDDFLHYLTDTAPGSSGSPVFNDQWELVALHHSGVPARDERGDILTIDDKIWQPSMGESRVKWLANEGVRISRIVEHIKQQNLSSEQKQLRDRLFVESDNRNEPHLPNSSQLSLSNREPETTSDRELSIREQSMTWTIPLQVTVNLGQAGVTVSPSVVTKAIDLSDELPQLISSNAQLQQEMQLLERVRRGDIPYYDKAEDKQDRNRYYGDLITEIDNLSSQKSFKKLTALLTQTHTNKLSYQPSTHLYPWVDLQPDLKIRSIYSKSEFTPEEIIQEDLQIERQRNTRLQEMMRSESFSKTANFRAELDLLEAQIPYNCEHVVPQSWFDRQEPMRGDLHHLFACEVKCNSFRGNTPYFDFVDFEEVIMSNCGKSERSQSKFEPSNGKGEVARATLYFLLRYPGTINNTIREYQSERLKILLGWHKNYPITDHERHRNMAIFKKQGNRNPLIDFPNWSDKLDFNLGLG